MSNTSQVLIVDDDPAILRLYRRMLGHRYSLDTASDASEALALWSENGPYPVVLSDLQMPGQNGLELLTTIGQLAPRTIGVLMSGGADERVDSALADGTIFAVLQKPFPVANLVELLETWLRTYAVEQQE